MSSWRPPVRLHPVILGKRSPGKARNNGGNRPLFRAIHR